MKCQCDVCRQLALSGKYVCTSCAEQYPSDNIKWVNAGNGKIRIYVRGYNEVEVLPMGTTERFLLNMRGLRPALAQLWHDLTTKAKGVFASES